MSAFRYDCTSSAAQLQTKLESVLASSAANLHANIESIIRLCEELELAKDEENINPDADEYFFCCYLLFLLIAYDLESSKYLWKRMQYRLRDNSDFFRIWNIAQLLWQHNIVDAFVAIDQGPWNFPNADVLIHALREVISRRQWTAIGCTYSSISFAELATLLGRNSSSSGGNSVGVEADAQLMGWEVDPSKSLVYPKPLGKTDDGELVNTEQIKQLATQVYTLEQQLPKLSDTTEKDTPSKVGK